MLKAEAQETIPENTVIVAGESEIAVFELGDEGCVTKIATLTREQLSSLVGTEQRVSSMPDSELDIHWRLAAAAQGAIAKERERRWLIRSIESAIRALSDIRGQLVSGDATPDRAMAMLNHALRGMVNDD